MRRRPKGFNRWVGLALAFVFAPVVTLFAASEYLDGTMRSGPYHSEQPRDIRTATVVSSDYHTNRGGSWCTVKLTAESGALNADVEDSRCFEKISPQDRVTLRVWRGDVTTIWDGPYSLWTSRNPDYQVHEWFPFTAAFALGTVALMIWAVWNFRRRRPPPLQMSLPLR